MLPLGAVIVDFDGTAALADVSEILLDAFGEPGWQEHDRAVERGEIGLRESMRRQALMLAGSMDEMLRFAIANTRLDPSFPHFVAWVEENRFPLTIVSDGFGFYLRPILEAAGLGKLDVLTNELVLSNGKPSLTHPNGHPECVGCGTCKMLAVLRARERHGSVVFIGNGQSDRYGALYSDVVFAKSELVAICERDGVPYIAWETFHDIRGALEQMVELPGAVAPQQCPGWTPA